MTNEAQGLTQPVILWGSTIAQPNVDSAVPNEQLANPFEIPIEVLAIRMRAYPIVTDSNNAVRVTGSGVKVKFDIGDVPVASDIPINLFGGVRETYENGQTIKTLDTDTVVAYPCTYDWKLKYPLFIPPGKTLSAVFTPIGINQLPVRVDVIYICRTWDVTRPLPKRVKAPWASSFESKSFRNEASVPAETSVSNALDVLNPFAVPLELDFIGGRCAALSLSTSFAAYTDIVYEDPLLYRHIRSTIRMRSSRGFDLIRTPVPFEGVFPAGWRGWDVPQGWQMSPQEYYRVQVDVAATDALVTSFYISQAQFSVGIVGYRDVEVASMGGKS